MVKKIFLAFFVSTVILYVIQAQSSPSKKCINSFITAMVNRHNELRALHRVSPLTHDLILHKSAQKYAEKIASLGYLVHSRIPHLGENLAYIMSNEYSDSAYECARLGKKMTDNWYNELYKPGYDYSRPGYQSGAGHFTQLIWKSSTSVGVGIAIKNGKEFYGVAQYTPQGNLYYVGEMAKAFKDNVLRLKH